MEKCYETCGYGYEWYRARWERGEMTDAEWDDWYYNHCGRCRYFSGYHCTLDDEEGE